MGARYGVLLFNLGGPGTLEDVEPFLVNLFSDRDIIELPLGAALQPAFARLVAKVRGPSVRRNYASIGGGSPQLRLTLGQAKALSARLSRGDGRVPVAVAMLVSPHPLGWGYLAGGRVDRPLDHQVEREDFCTGGPVARVRILDGDHGQVFR